MPIKFGYKLINGIPFPYSYHEGEHTDGNGKSKIPTDFITLPVADENLTLDQLKTKYPYERKE